MKLKTLGKLQLEESDFTRQKPLLLLCYLAIEGPQSRRVLADLFFLESKNPRDALSTSYRRLKKLNLVDTENKQIFTTINCDSNDLLKELEQHNHQTALELYTGSFLAGLDIKLGEELEEWVFITREFLAAKVRQAHFDYADILLTQANLKAAAKLVEQALRLEGAAELEPEHYARAYTVLSLSKSPLAANLKTEAEAFGISLNLNPEPIPHSNKKATPPHNLIAASSSFVGRDPELLELASLMNETHVRLITIHGPGGVGKSRLAIQAAFDQLSLGKFEDGIFFISLDTLMQGEQIPLRIASALDISLKGSSDSLEQIKTFLKEAHALLIFDNYEHLITSRSIVSELLETCVDLKILVTSRERLNLIEENVLPVAGLPLPKLSASFEELSLNDAVQLFIKRAKKAILTFTVTEENLVDITTLVHLLEGSPLGIELAAAWVRALPLAEIIQEIESNLDFLASSSQNAIGRHQSTRATFEYSWKLLSKRDQDVLAKLSVFRGGFTREAASYVVGTTLIPIVNLVDKSLLNLSSNARFNRHALIFQFTQEKLSGQHELQLDMQKRHANYYLSLSEKAEHHFQAGQQKIWLDRFEQEQENLQIALAWFLEHKMLSESLSLVSILGRFWLIRGYLAKGRQYLETVLSHPKANTLSKERAKAVGAAGGLAFTQADYVGAQKLYTEGLRIHQNLKDKLGIALSLGNLGTVAERQGNYQEALLLFKKSLAALREINDKHKIASTLNGLAIVCYSLGDAAESSTYFEESLALRRELGDKHGVAASLSNLSSVWQAQGKYDEAIALLEESLNIRRELGDKHGIAVSLNNLGAAYEVKKDYSKALELQQESLAIKQELGDQYSIAITLCNLGVLAQTSNDYLTARSYFNKSLSIRQTIEDRNGIALSFNYLGELTELEGDYLAAHTFYKQSLEMSSSLKDKVGIVTSIENIAQLSSKSSQNLEFAVPLWGAANTIREELDIPMKPQKNEQTLKAIHIATQYLGKNTFDKLLHKGKQLSMDEAVLYALSESHLSFGLPHAKKDS